MQGLRKVVVYATSSVLQDVLNPMGLESFSIQSLHTVLFFSIIRTNINRAIHM